MKENIFTLEVQPNIPPNLSRLEELAEDLYYSWDRHVRALFVQLDPELWEACGHNPKVFLRRIAQHKLEEAAQVEAYIADYNRTLSAYDTYHEQAALSSKVAPYIDPDNDLVAYFCAEFGFHESVPLYSGGLGILAGDHCKAASDLRLPLVAVGLLYRKGYFSQTIDHEGNQQAHYAPSSISELPITPCLDDDGEQVQVSVDAPGREIHLRVWQMRAGHVLIYLLDSEVPENDAADRAITYQLYGGDAHMRILQELCLGLGGVRALRKLGISPSVWHINEGHSAFQIVERCRELISEGYDSATAIEAVASETVFTTHTPVPAGHDIFEPEIVAEHLAPNLADTDIPIEDILALGNGQKGFNMTSLALRGSRFHNGVSAIHGGVASQMEQHIWPEIPAQENSITSITNGIHVPTFLAQEWANLFDQRWHAWRNQLLNEDFWNVVDELPDHRFWSMRRSLKSELLRDVYQRVLKRCRRNGMSDAMIERMTSNISNPDPDLLVIGFARRFATYKRALLIFYEIDRLKELLNDPQRPVILIFAGKAHPHDEKGQAMIRRIHELSLDPDLIGKIILLEDYDMAQARKLVTGVDVWLNNPEYPLEACGTSGQKAAINGVLNLSVLDGWWDEGYEKGNGWAILPHSAGFDPEYRDREEARDLLNLLSDEVIPLYFNRGNSGYATEWVKMSKAAMRTTLPRFNAQRMVMDYVSELYAPARAQSKVLQADSLSGAQELARWKERVREHWGGTWLERIDAAPTSLLHGESLPIRVKAHLNGLSCDDVTVECRFSAMEEPRDAASTVRYQLQPEGETEDGMPVFAIDIEPRFDGLQYYRICMYPTHPLASHPFEFGGLRWL
ncbi:alpha-glucan family phosphorylase [Halorhodospira halochloris]|uniref:alpha-glucan family phosphorylase n=1 Tax=Halorhodospira halochloris TaxID=1052 RepID=UPI001EE79883|nr:alpha-glucan family phosphorylase [Halorhodospira halochloris]MCG5549104.1 alpha-glucan family phosphorylase [Halorhodospira halochloris]